MKQIHDLRNTVFDADLPTGAVLDRFSSRSDPELRLCRSLRTHLERRRSVRITRAFSCALPT